MYTQAFELAVDHAMHYEVSGSWNLNIQGVIDGTNHRACGYTNDPTDAGGETKFGISKRANPTVDILNLTWDDAKDIYYQKYWLAGSCDDLSGRVAVLHFDGCINHGISAASKFLQRALNVSDDGHIGPKTILAANNGNSISICQQICDERLQYYKNIVANNPSQSKYIKGWTRRIEEMRTFTTDPNNNF